MNKVATLSGMALAMILSTGVAVAGDQVEAQVKSQVQNQEKNQVQTQQILGRQIMTPEEQNEQRAKTRNATSQEERNKIRSEHHEEMKERAQEKGVSIPDFPPARGQGGGMGGGGRGGR